MQIKGSDALDFYEARAAGYDLLEKGDSFGFLIICGINFGLRISDLLTIDYGQLKSGAFVISEKKRGKRRKIVVNETVEDCLAYMEELDPVGYQLGGKVFKSRKGSVYSPQQVNRKLKQVFGRDGMLVTTHSLRKTFGKRLYEVSGQNIALVQLQLRHSSPEATLAYIGVTQDQMDDCFSLID